MLNAVSTLSTAITAATATAAATAAIDATAAATAAVAKPIMLTAEDVLHVHSVAATNSSTSRSVANTSTSPPFLLQLLRLYGCESIN